MSTKNSKKKTTSNLASILKASENIDKSLSEQKSILFSDIEQKNTCPVDYLYHLSPIIDEQLLTNENFLKIQEIAEVFDENITSFFGFETRLHGSNKNSDYLLAISSKNGEKEALLNIFENKSLPEEYLRKEEWSNLQRFTQKWNDKNSPINKNVLGVWFEFDTSIISSDVTTPNIFLQVKKIRIDNNEDLKNISWVLKEAIPLLIGNSLPKESEKNIIAALKKLPPGTSLVHVGTMLSRKENGIRLVINRITPEQIIPYLKSIGWEDNADDLTSLLEELSKHTTRLILHINIGPKIDGRIGLECSFDKDRYHEESGWKSLLDFLEKKKLCLPEKKRSLLGFIGADFEDGATQDNDFEYVPSVLLKDFSHSKVLTRYISHIKLLYLDGKIEVKAYPGVRLIGKRIKE